MKTRKLLCLLLLAALLSTLLLGCTSAEETAHAQTQTKVMIDALIAKDYATAYGLISGVVTEAEFQQFYSQATALLEGVTTYELQTIGSYVNFSLKNSHYEKTYQLMIDDVAVAEIKSAFYKASGEMCGFWITLPEQSTSDDLTTVA